MKKTTFTTVIALIMSVFGLQAQTWTAGTNGFSLTPTTANVGLGVSASSAVKLKLENTQATSSTLYGMHSAINNTHATSSSTTYGVQTNVTSQNAGSIYGHYVDAKNANTSSTANTYGTRTAVTSYNTGIAYGNVTVIDYYNTSSTANVFGVYTDVRNSSNNNTVYGVYSNVSNGNGNKRWAGYFTGGDMYVSGNVGIGTTNPTTKLHVVGTTQTDLLLINKPNTTTNWNNLWQSGFFESENATNAPESSGWFWGINMGHRSNNSAYRYGGQLLIRSNPTSPTMYFRSTDVNGNGTWAKVLSSVGGQNISGFLSVERNENISSAGYVELRNIHKTQNGTANSWKIYNMTGDYGNSLQFWAYDNVGCGNSGALCTPRVVFMDNGNVGIGTTSPQYKLDIAGTVQATEVLTSRVGDTFNDNFTYDGKSLSHFSLNWIHDSWFSGARSLWQSAWGGMKFFTQGLPRLVIHYNGNVGIGYTNPTAKLDVNGIIRAHEVKVCLNQGCDYVFEEDYKLMNLAELNKFIKTNKHLPEVAPAAVMESEGINISEMSALLLKKVEELTLYVIEQNKAIEDLQRKNAELEYKMSKR